MAIKETIKDAIKELSFKKVEDTESLLESRLLSSIMVVDLAVSLEDSFKIKIPFSEITKDNFETVDLIEQYLITKGVNVTNA
ncbi:MAG TPA: phosphopantetheine-binding protein [Bacteroidia bacterium]|nr:phosphopantetheine-binding protein [Bacteroidia bacterium]